MGIFDFFRDSSKGNTPDSSETPNVPTSARSAFDQHAEWAKLPDSLLVELSTRLKSAEQATNFITLMERSGIYDRLIQPLVDSSLEDPGYAVYRVAIMLTSYANGRGDRGDIEEARESLQIALDLNPNHVPAWSSMAIAEVNSGNCEEAVKWAKRVLDYDPAAHSNGSAKTVDVGPPAAEQQGSASDLDEPSLEEGLEDVKDTMREIIKLCQEQGL